MEITEEQYQRVKHLFPVARGRVKLSNLAVLNAVLYLAEQGCQGWGLPESFGNWHTVYMRWSRWNERGVLAQVFAARQELGFAIGIVGHLGTGQCQRQGTSGRYGGAEKRGRKPWGSPATAGAPSYPGCGRGPRPGRHHHPGRPGGGRVPERTVRGRGVGGKGAAAAGGYIAAGRRML